MTNKPDPENQNTNLTKKPARDLAGTVLLERYRILKKLGGGGMGDVYLGEHTVIGKKVAVKVLHPQSGTPTSWTSPTTGNVRTARSSS